MSGPLLRRAGLAALAVTLAVALSPVGPASAAPITLSLSFSASSFTNSAPVDPVTGTFTVTYDPAGGNVFNQSAITMDAINIPLGAIRFHYLPGTDTMSIFGLVSGQSLDATANDLFMQVRPSSQVKQLDGLFYTSFGQPELIYAARVHSIGVAVPIPAPATGLLLVVGIAGLAALRRRATARG